MTRRRGVCALQPAGLGLLWSVIAVAVPLGSVAGSEHDARTDDAGIDCGTMALGALLLLERYPAGPDAILAHLKPSSSAGYSLEELRDAAGACGLRLRGVRLNKDEGAIDRPMIVFFMRSRNGHYRVIRPVGHTGKLAQVIDPNLPPYVVDKLAMFATPEWTGIALVPDRRPGWPIRIALGLLSGSALAGVAWIGMRRRRWLRDVGGRPITVKAGAGSEFGLRQGQKYDLAQD
jgi:hypothetical protein